MRKVLNLMIIIVAAGAFYYYFENDIKAVWARYFPCRQPISYSLLRFDEQFGVSREWFLEVVAEAESVWEQPIGKELFVQKEGGRLKINLIYDDRQEATETLREIGDVVESNQDSYDTMKSRYESLKAQFEEDKAAHVLLQNAVESRLDIYNREVGRLNRRGGASGEDYDRLQSEKAAIEREIVELEALEAKLDEEVREINALVKSLNNLAETLNIHVANYNEIGKDYREFEEGTYVSEGGEVSINIYQFDDRQKLFQVLAHELGHALGLDHVDDPEALMYYLNSGDKPSLSASDVAILKAQCGVQ